MWESEETFTPLCSLFPPGTCRPHLAPKPSSPGRTAPGQQSPCRGPWTVLSRVPFRKPLSRFSQPPSQILHAPLTEVNNSYTSSQAIRFHLKSFQRRIPGLTTMTNHQISCRWSVVLPSEHVQAAAEGLCANPGWPWMAPDGPGHSRPPPRAQAAASDYPIRAEQSSTRVSSHALLSWGKNCNQRPPRCNPKNKTKAKTRPAHTISISFHCSAPCILGE